VHWINIYLFTNSFVASLSPAAIGAVCKGQWLPERELIASGALADVTTSDELSMSGYGSGRYRPSG
jgi:hypothetical protein